MTYKMILDTDIGTDVDDLMALSLILASPELELLGITLAYGDTRLRAKLTHRVLELAGRSGIPLVPGTSHTLTGHHKIFWPGHEGQNAGITEIPDSVIPSGQAEDFIIEQVERFPGEVTLVAIAPLANLARAILKSSDGLQKVRQIVMMGGVFGASDPTLELSNRTEHNIHSDPEAARVVFSSGLPITLVPLDVTTRVALHPEDVARIGCMGSPLTRLLHAELTTWLGYIAEVHGRNYTHMHDPLTVALLLEPHLVRHRVQVGLEVECRGEHTLGMTVPRPNTAVKNVDVVLEVDVEDFRELFLSRLERLGVTHSPGTE